MSDIDADEARRRLYEVVSGDASFETKAEQALEIGTAYLDVDNGLLTKIDPHTDYWEVVVSTDPDRGQFGAGLVADFEEAYCRRAVRRETSVALHDVPAQGWGDDPAFETHGLHCYHGTPIAVDGDTYGTVCFVSESPREPFADGETMFAELVARLLERELERQRHEAELTRQSNLSNVLNRVLRHNLRNSMAVIRGRAQQIADEYSDVGETQPIIEHADQLIDLGEKARSLESVLVSQADRAEVDLRPLLDRTTQSVREAYPTASVTVDCPDDAVISACPSLETALYELVENAAKHTGPEPTVTVSAELVPDGVEITVADDGPGIADCEQRVLTEGVETSLSHGTGLGLWLVHWVVTSHDGRIEATTSGEGTRMTVQLPRRTSATDPEDSRDVRQLDRVQNKFRAVFGESSDAMLITDDDGRYIDVNRRAADLFGLPRPGHLLGRSIAEFTPEEVDPEATRTEFCSTDESRGTIPIVRPDGTERIVEYTTKTDVVPGQHLTILRDVTEREARKQDLELAETVFENVQDAVFLVDVTDESFRVRCVNEAYETLTGLSNDDIRGQTPREIFGDDIGAEIEARYRECVERRDTLRYSEEIPVDGELRDWETKLTPVVEDGTVVKLVGAMRDVTERNERQRDLELKNQSIEEAPIGITIADASQDGTPLVYTNEAFERLTGYADEDILGQNCRFLHGDETDPETVATLRDAIRSERPVSVDIRNYRADGTAFWNEVTIAPVVNDAGETTHFVGFQQDVTARRERKQELLQLRQVLESVLSNVPVVFWTTDADGVFTRSRGDALEKIGLEPGEVVGDSVFDVFESRPEVCDHVRRALAGERVATSVTVDDVVFDSWHQPLRTGNGDVAGVVGLAYDLTQYRQRVEG